ncbi:hypothetical protein G7046_g6809 [Stylonectria norvegica]|nr:hypothetical protein G7046_g6809 [Stylonectria norvegica]
MSVFQGVGSKFEGSDSQAFHGSVSVNSSNLFVEPSGASSQTSLSLTSNASVLPPTTHDTIKSNHHMKNFETFVGDLQLSAKRAFPNSAYSRYKEVQVLLIRWEEDELEVEWELDELHKVFRDLYLFQTEQFLIPTQNSHRRLNRKALSFVEDHEEEDVLLIVYYGGHGVINKARQSTWSCKTDTTYATVEWSAIQTLFEMVKCDVLLLLDCCAGASAAPLVGRPTNIKETIAACGFETWTPRPGPQSFTHALIEVLMEWASQLPFSAAMLHSEILTRLKHAQPRRSPQGAWVESRRTPAYIVSTPDPHTASITLGRLIGEEPESSSSSQAVPGSFPSNLSEMVQGDSHVSSQERLAALLSMDEQGQRKAPHVLLTVALEDDQVLDAASCARWLKQFPLLATYVSIEGVYRSYSTLILLSVPVVLWNLLPDHPATQFVGYVRSRNLSPRDGARNEAVTPIPIAGHSARDQLSNNLDLASPSNPVWLSSLDSGYDSSGVLGPAGLLAMVRNARQMADIPGRTRTSLPSLMLAGKRRARGSVTELLSPTSRSSQLPVDAKLARQGNVPEEKSAKRLIVTVGQAALNDDKLGLTCVLEYGDEVQRSEPIRRATPIPVWNQEFRFEVHDSPMFYHLRLSVWGAQMLELIGELHVDLRDMVQNGQLPELSEWPSLRCDGRSTGLIRISLAYLDVSEDDQRQAEVSKTAGRPQQQGRRRKGHQNQLHDGQSRMQELDFKMAGAEVGDAQAHCRIDQFISEREIRWIDKITSCAEALEAKTVPSAPFVAHRLQLQPSVDFQEMSTARVIDYNDPNDEKKRGREAKKSWKCHATPGPAHPRHQGRRWISTLQEDDGRIDAAKVSLNDRCESSRLMKAVTLWNGTRSSACLCPSQWIFGAGVPPLIDYGAKCLGAPSLIDKARLALSPCVSQPGCQKCYRGVRQAAQQVATAREYRQSFNPVIIIDQLPASRSILVEPSPACRSIVFPTSIFWEPTKRTTPAARASHAPPPALFPGSFPRATSFFYTSKAPPLSAIISSSPLSSSCFPLNTHSLNFFNPLPQRAQSYQSHQSALITNTSPSNLEYPSPCMLRPYRHAQTLLTTSVPHALLAHFAPSRHHRFNPLSGPLPHATTTYTNNMIATSAVPTIEGVQGVVVSSAAHYLPTEHTTPSVAPSLTYSDESDDQEDELVVPVSRRRRASTRLIAQSARDIQRITGETTAEFVGRCCGGVCCSAGSTESHVELEDVTLPDNDAFKALGLKLGEVPTRLTGTIDMPEKTASFTSIPRPAKVSSSPTDSAISFGSTAGSDSESDPATAAKSHNYTPGPGYEAVDTSIQPPRFVQPHPPHHVYPARIHSTRELTKPGAEKRTYHFDLDITDYPVEEMIDFKVGGAIGIMAPNCDLVVEDVLDALMVPRFQRDKPVLLRTTKGRWPTVWGDDKPRELVTTRRDLLTWCTDIQSYAPTKPLLRVLAEHAAAANEKKILLYLCSNEGQSAFCDFRGGADVTVSQILNAFPSSHPPMDELLSVLQPLMPRFYSLSNDPSESYQLRDHAQRRLVEIAVTVHEALDYQRGCRTGVGSGFFERQARKFLRAQRSGEKMPEFYVPMFKGLMANPLAKQFNSDGPMLLIGAGVGIAPFRGFVQRRLKQANCANKVWVLQGIRDSLVDEIYSGEWGVHEDEVKRVVQSRAGTGKYVQEEVCNQSDLVWYIINSLDGRVFVCGSSRGMGEGVEEALVEVAMAKGNLEREEARAFWTLKKSEGQYIAETW